MAFAKNESGAISPCEVGFETALPSAAVWNVHDAEFGWRTSLGPNRGRGDRGAVQCGAVLARELSWQERRVSTG